MSGKKAELEKISFDKMDILCCVCTNKNNTKTVATKYCLTCEDYYFIQCVKLHEIVPALSLHVIVEKTDYEGRDDGTKQPPIPTERCAEHPARLVDMYCKPHDQVGCDTCMITKHTSE